MRGYAFEDNNGGEEEEAEEEETEDSDLDNPYDAIASADEPPEHFGYGACESPNFSKAEHEFLKYISSSQYLPGILERIKLMPVRTEYKQALVDEVASLLSPETVYANSSAINGMFGIKRDVVRVKMIDAKLRLRLTRFAATKSDLSKVNAQRIEGAILGVYINYLSRSVGKDRERLIQEIGSKMISVSETRDGTTAEVDITPQKKSFWGIGRRR